MIGVQEPRALPRARVFQSHWRPITQIADEEGGEAIDEVKTARGLCEKQGNQGVVFVGTKQFVCQQRFSAD